MHKLSISVLGLALLCGCPSDPAPNTVVGTQPKTPATPTAPASGPAASAPATPATPATPSAPASGPAAAVPTPITGPKSPGSEPPTLARCYKFPAGVTVISKPEQLASLVREEAPMSDGCPAELPPSGIDFNKDHLVLAFVTATCRGTISASPKGFVWSEEGNCERAEILKSSTLVPKEIAPTLKLIKVEK